ncbi:serine/threonine protein kinase, partial [Archangium sp.]|uniref:serine/threonine protein kinase n=1 Tax=Archangium sp. TaxID=1872627 RepID=UPI002D5F1EC7
MTTETLHPDHLKPGHMVGPWRIVDRLGVGGSARVFKVERDGVLYTMKMALRPLSTEEDKDEPGEGTAGTWRMRREVAALLTCSPHPNLLRVHALDCWPHPRKGYPFFVTDLVEGDDWHNWRWRTNPDAARLVDTFSAVVRTVAVLHERGVYHRDLKAENLLIRREDDWPFLIDFGDVRLPGAFVLTLGVPYGAFHLLPPELMEYTRSDAWRQGVPFQGGVAADLYALGVLLYQGLTNKHPFNPELPDQELVAAISTVRPVAPHLLNPRAPRSLSDIALKLLEKRPEDRYPDTQALLQALWKTTGERKSSAWKIPLLPPGEIPPAEATSEQKEESMIRGPQAIPPPGEPSPPADTQPRHETGEETPPPAHHMRRVAWLFALVAGLTLLGILWWGVRSGHAPIGPPPEAEPPVSASHPKGSQPVPVSISREPTSSTPDTPRSSLFGALLCVVTGLGCPAAQVKPQPPAYGERCPREAQRFMFEELKI